MPASRPLRILAFEGPDKVGKTTIIRELNRRTNYEYLCIDRFTGSAWVYDSLSGRRQRKDILSRAELELSKLTSVTFITIILKCDISVLMERVAKAGESDITNVPELKKAGRLYEEYSHQISTLRSIEIDTTEKTVDETVTEIIRKVEEL